MGSLISLFWTFGESALDFKTRLDPLLSHLCDPQIHLCCAPADCIYVSMTAEPFRSTYLQICEQVLVKDQRLNPQLSVRQAQCCKPYGHCLCNLIVCSHHLSTHIECTQGVPTLLHNDSISQQKMAPFFKHSSYTPIHCRNTNFHEYTCISMNLISSKDFSVQMVGTPVILEICIGIS